MSFLINENDFINNIVKLSINKIAQVVNNQTITVAKKLINNLSQSYSTQANISALPNSNLNIENVQSLDNLLNFITSQQVKLNNARIAYLDNDPSLTDQIKKSLTLQDSFYINLPALYSYVASLSQKASQGKDQLSKIFKTSVDKIISQIKAIRPEADVLKQPKVENNTPIDYMNEKIFNLDSPLTDQGESKKFPLLLKDIDSLGSLANWSKGSIISNSQGSTEFDKAKTTAETKANLQNIIKVLLDRAENRKLYNMPLADEYINKLKQLSGASPSSETSQTPKEEVLRNVISSLPLNLENIDLDAINNFYKQLKEFFAGDKNFEPKLDSIYNNLSIAQNQAKRHLINPDVAIPINQPPESLFTLVLPGNHYLPLMQNLKAIITLTNQMITLIKSFARSRQLPADQMSEINSQIGVTASDYPIFIRNLERINFLESKAPKPS